MARVTVHAVGAVTVGDAYVNAYYSTPPVVVGDPPQWNDDSDATYSEQDTFEHPDVSYTDPATATLERGLRCSTNPALVKVTAHIRYQCLSVDMLPPRCAVQHTGVTGSLLYADPPAGMPGSMAPTWLELQLPEVSDGRMATFLDRVNDTSGTLTIQVTPSPLWVYSYRQSRTRIYEAYLVVQTVSDAPPCRIFPRSDGVGLAGGRSYPPAKSQQRSIRGIGYY